MSGRYEKLNEIGSGTFGRAWLVRRRDAAATRKYVIKEVQVSGMSEKDKYQSLTEVEALAKCKHVNIIRYKEAFVENGLLHIVMEYGDGGDLKKKITDAKGEHFAEETILDWFTQLAFALKYIHGLKILHRDLKTQNIFIVGKDVLKVGDFGIARILESTTDQASTAIGTPYYLSPEICRRKSYNNKSDMWAMGCVLYELCCLRHPFDGNNMSSLVVNILHGKFSPIPSQYGALLDDLVHALLQVEPEARPSASQVLAIPALQKAINQYIGRMKLARLRSSSSPCPTRREKTCADDAESIAPQIQRVKETGNEDKENIRPKESKEAPARRVSWATPKASPLVECKRVVNSADITKDNIKSGKSTPTKSPTVSLYRDALKRWKEAERIQQSKRRLSMLRKAPGTPVPHRVHTPHSKVAKSKMRVVSPNIGKVVASAECRHGKRIDSETFSVRRRSSHKSVDGQGCESDAAIRTPEIRITPPRESVANEDSDDVFVDTQLSICRLLYDCCSARSMEQTMGKLELLREFLETNLGMHEFLRDYTTLRDAIANGREFDQVEGLVRVNLKEYFPLVIQLIQMEYCTKL